MPRCISDERLQVVVVANDNQQPPVHFNQKIRHWWPEKIAAGTAIVIAAIMFSIWILLAICAGSMRDSRLNAAAVRWFLDSELVIVPPLWLILRAAQIVLNNWKRWRP